ncbi:hypothetical protein DFH07DRAFT_962395 [Mycena maculata]|uniref:Protein-S-isoprenylcysteine O-methyltransferase n=1 Tax=Mycena maculata TaxID=230809 RepID=A0AAD7N6N8_9AGAR|nr:hypothetical protein DFH07DRAFT_962395 [Mycena maculata]
MAFTKILCILAATLGLHAASTSPNPPLRESEKTIAPTKLEFILGSYQLRFMLTAFYWLLAMAETAATVAPLASSSIWAQRILSIVAVGGDQSKVHLSPTPTLALGAILIACGAVLRLQCYWALGSQFTFETGILKDHKLVTMGPYAFVRHPSYAGAFLAYAGLMLYYGSPGSWVMECLVKGSTAGMLFGGGYAFLMFLVVLGLTWRIPKEDEGLRRKFGEEWDAYAAAVRYAIVPRVW